MCCRLLPSWPRPCSSIATPRPARRMAPGLCPNSSMPRTNWRFRPMLQCRRVRPQRRPRPAPTFPPATTPANEPRPRRSMRLRQRRRFRPAWPIAGDHGGNEPHAKGAGVEALGRSAKWCRRVRLKAGRRTRRPTRRKSTKPEPARRPGVAGTKIIAAKTLFGAAKKPSAAAGARHRRLFARLSCGRRRAAHQRSGLAGDALVAQPQLGPSQARSTWSRTLPSTAQKLDDWPGLLVGDISQPRGGPMLTGHASHQLGLDADIWLTPMPDRKANQRRARKHCRDLDARQDRSRRRQEGVHRKAGGADQARRVLS